MRTIYGWIITIAVASLSNSAMADNGRDRRAAGDAPPHPMQVERGPGPSERGRESVEALLDRLRMDDPDECKRLETLREDDPSQFRNELRARLARERRRVFAQNRRAPEMHIKRGERAYGASLDARRIRGKDTPDHEESATRKIKRDIAIKIRQYKQADDEARPALAEDLKSALGDIFDMHQQRRIDTIERMEIKIEEMKRLLAERGRTRSEIIERQFQDVTDNSHRSTE